MTHRGMSLVVGWLMVLAGMALVWLTSAGNMVRAAEAPGGPATGKVVLRVAAGRDAPYKDAQGNTWEADTGFEGGSTIERPQLNVTGTTEPGLYRAEHYSMDSWSCQVPNGAYSVKLHFSEGYDGVTSPSDRVFTFDVQGQTFKDFSPWKKAGAQFKAYIETVKDVKVTDGRIKITFTPQVENTQVNAIEIYSADGSAPDAAAQTQPAAATKAILRVAAGRETAYKDAQGNIWEADKGFEGGATVTRPEVKFSGTTEGGLYVAERYAMESYTFKIPNGTYVVKLHFSEGSDGITAAENRVFTFDVQGQKFKDFSPWKKAGGQYKAYVETVKGVKVTEGQIKITFTAQVGPPQINALEIYAADASAPATTAATQSNPTPGKVVLRMVAGDTPVKDSKGNTWIAEEGFDGGQTIQRSDLNVTGTTEPGIYRAEHYSMDSWSYKLPNGKYVLKLHFSEDYEGMTDSNGRLFTYAVKDGTPQTGTMVKEVKNFGPWKAAGASMKAYVDTIPVTVTKGQISLVFTPEVENPQINAIEIYPAEVP